jgi:hypothetical protein
MMDRTMIDPKSRAPRPRGIIVSGRAATGGVEEKFHCRSPICVRQSCLIPATAVPRRARSGKQTLDSHGDAFISKNGKHADT